jgi:hypothetical protein
VFQFLERLMPVCRNLDSEEGVAAEQLHDLDKILPEEYTKNVSMPRPPVSSWHLTPTANMRVLNFCLFTGACRDPRIDLCQRRIAASVDVATSFRNSFVARSRGHSGSRPSFTGRNFNVLVDMSWCCNSRLRCFPLCLGTSQELALNQTDNEDECDAIVDAMQRFSFFHFNFLILSLYLSPSMV